MVRTNFPTAVNTQPAAGIPGDFASTNPRGSVLAGPGGLVAGPSGLTIARFAWLSYEITDANDAPAEANNYGPGVPDGFVHREQQGLITEYLDGASMFIPAGFGVTLTSFGDLWVQNDGLTDAIAGMKCFATHDGGKAIFAAAGATPSTASASAGTVAAKEATATAGTIDDNILTTGATVGGDPWVVGALVGGTGVASGTRIVDQISGTPGGVGTYRVSIPAQSVAATALTGDYGLFTAAGSIVGAFSLGDILSGTNVTTGSYITGFGTGTGGLGTYYVSVADTASATAITAALAVETKWRAVSGANPGEPVKITSTAQ